MIWTSSSTSIRVRCRATEVDILIRGILFDFFGTLVRYSTSRTEQGYPQTHALLQTRSGEMSYVAFLDHWVAIFEELDAWSQVEQREYSMLDGAHRFLTRIQQSDYDEPFAVGLGDLYVQEWSKGVEYLPGVPDLLLRLADQYVLGVVTNTHHSSMVQDHLQTMGVLNLFRTVVTSVEHGRPKPHADVFLHALRELGTSPRETIFVGDSYLADYSGARAVGMPALLIDPRGEHDIPLDHRLTHILDLEQHLVSSNPP